MVGDLVVGCGGGQGADGTIGEAWIGMAIMVRWGRWRNAVVACAALAGASTVSIAGETRHHALSTVGVPAKPAGFMHFDWVDPAAPKGGRVRMRAIGSFDTLNAYAIKGAPAAGLSVIDATLMTESLAEPSSIYGLVAEWVRHPLDFSSATFSLRPEAVFHDGSPITPEDVVFTLDALKRASPRYALYYQNVAAAEKTGPREVTFRFTVTGNRELPYIVGTLPVLSRAYWTAKGADGEARDITRTTLEPPLGSGPYRIKEVVAGRTITYQREARWWASDLPVMRGQWNLDEIRYEYYRERVAAFEAFKAGNIDFWAEFSAKAWATGYEFDAVRQGHVLRQEWRSDRLVPMQGFAFNLRRPQFQDARVRRAFNLAFDFEWASKNVLFDQYKRASSYFEGSELKAQGLPEGRELALLESVRGGAPPEVFTTPFANPVNGKPEDVRRHMGEAARLLAAAGWRRKDSVLINAAGEPFQFEFLLVSPDFERVVQPYRAALEKLGIRASVRVVDSAQYQRRSDTFDFDVIVAGFRQSLSPGNEQRQYWGSVSADKPGSNNLMGIKSPAIDALIEHIVFAKDRAELVAATRALDRVLLWSHYVVPQWYAPTERVAMWEKYAGPKAVVGHASATHRFLQTWWYDALAAGRLATVRGR